MGFKVKKWGCAQTITLADYDQAAKAQSASGGSSRCFPWAGKLLFLAYSAVDAPVWYTYDPTTTAWTGPHPGPAGIANWAYNNPVYGDLIEYAAWGSTWLLGYGMVAGSGVGSEIFFGWDATGNLFEWTPPACPGSTNKATVAFAGVGVDGAGNPVKTVWQSWDMTTERLASYGPGGEVIDGPRDKATQKYIFPLVSGSTMFAGAMLGAYWRWKAPAGSCGDALIDDKMNVYPYAPTLLSGVCAPSLKADVEPRFGTSVPDGGRWLTFTPRDTGVPVTADLRTPLVAGTPPYASTWEYRRLCDGAAYPLDGGDLDGVGHGTPNLPVASRVTLCSNGLYAGIGSATGGVSVTLYRLDPNQPQGMEQRRGGIGSGAIGWIGEWAIRPNLRVEKVLPFPDLRVGDLYAQPAAEQKDGYVLTAKELYKRRGASLSYERDIVVELSGYPTDSPDWWWPGDWIDPAHHAGFWNLFAEGSVIARMPDPMWGLYSPVGSDVQYGMGIPYQTNLEATAPAPTHVVRSASLVGGSSAFVQPFTPGSTGRRRSLVSLPEDDGLLLYYASELRIMSPPAWKARVGRISGGVWQEVLAFDGMSSPGLGETGWTVWSVVPIRPCAPLPKGGYLVGATLYFAPWGTTWEHDVGTRDATFRDSGQGFVPALPGTDGPCLDYHAPVYLAATDEWTANRSLYGPDALLVYDPAGAFVECLNSEGLYPPDGREILVTREAVPRLIFRVYRQGTYSDYAEGWGAYHALAADQEIVAPLYACYDLLDSSRRLSPGAGRFRGFLDMYDVGRTAGSWRWTQAAGSLYDWTSPKSRWSPVGGAHIRLGRGGQTVTPLGSGSPDSRPGTKGVGQRA